MKSKYFTLIMISIILIAGTFLIAIPNNKVDCSKPLDVIYLKPSEISQASDIANKISGVVVIPELNRVIARTEVLQCSSFNYEDYIKSS